MKKRSVIFAALAFLTLASGCSAPRQSTQSLVPFEKQRTAAVEYLKAFNRVDNDFSQTVSSIDYSPSAGGTPNLLQFNSAVNQLLTTFQGALERTNELRAPNVEGASAHLAAYKKMLQEGIASLRDLQTAISAGDQAKTSAAVGRWANVGQQMSACNRLTEALMLKFNVPDKEVDYQFRGK